MKIYKKLNTIICGTVLTLLILASAGRTGAKDKNSSSNPNDPTFRIFNLLDSKYNGKLDDFCVLADLIGDPKNPGQRLQRVISMDYSKDKAFGKFNIHVRTVAPLTPDQLKTYTPKQTFDFAETDSAKFIKSDAGSFGRTGDLYFEAPAPGEPLAISTITPEVESEYEMFVTQYLMPALEKKAEGGTGS